jgi:hypothetical protein
MATRKMKSEATRPKARTAPAPADARAARPAAQPAVSGDSNRLLREAAWSRMFGRTESKNPFAR